eukprot:evm.model.NODE_29430_length_3190_cov_19.691849.1
MGAGRDLDEAAKTSGSSKGFPAGVGGDDEGNKAMETILPESEAVSRGEKRESSGYVRGRGERHG